MVSPTNPPPPSCSSNASPKSMSSGIVTSAVTMTCIASVAVPPGPVAVMVYSTVSVGETMVEPFAPTLPMPGSITQESASVEPHVSVDDSPTRIVPGSALMVTVGGSISSMTSIVRQLPGALAIHTDIELSLRRLTGLSSS